MDLQVEKAAIIKRLHKVNDDRLLKLSKIYWTLLLKKKRQINSWKIQLTGE